MLFGKSAIISQIISQPAKKIVAPLPDHETLTFSLIVKLVKGKPSTVNCA